MTIDLEFLERSLTSGCGINSNQSNLLRPFGLRVTKGWKKRILKIDAPEEIWNQFASLNNKTKRSHGEIVKMVLTPKEEKQARKRRERKARIRERKVAKESSKKKDRVEYFSYMKSKSWRERSKRCITEAGFQCEICSGIEGGLAAHHYNYLNLGNETRLDLFCLCSPCHSDYHAAFPAKLLPQDKHSSRPSRLYHLTLEIARYRIRPAFSGRDLSLPEVS